MVKLNPFRTPDDMQEAERWLGEALTVAVIKRSTAITIRHRDHRIEGLIHDCGSEDCVGRMRPLDTEHFQALLEVLQRRLNCPDPIDASLNRRYGRFSECLHDVRVSADVYASTRGLSPQLDLFLRYEPS